MRTKVHVIMSTDREKSLKCISRLETKMCREHHLHIQRTWTIFTLISYYITNGADTFGLFPPPPLFLNSNLSQSCCHCLPLTTGTSWWTGHSVKCFVQCPGRSSSHNLLMAAAQSMCAFLCGHCQAYFTCKHESWSCPWITHTD